MSKPTIHGRQLAARSLALVALTSLVVLAGHSGGRPALSDSGNRLNASKPADQAVSSLGTKLDRAPQALGTVPLHFARKRESLYSSVATSAGGGRFAASGKTASAKTQESVRILKQRGQYESLRAAVEKSRYRVEESTRVSSASSGTYIASNHAQNFRTEFTKTGASVEPSSSDRPRWRWKLRLTGYGYGETLRPLSKTGMTSADNRVEYRYRVRPSSSGKGKIRSTPPSGANGGERAALTEWYVNDARGVEHGFTLYSPPAGARKVSSPAAISASARTPLSPSRTLRQEPAPDSEFLHLALDVSGNLQGRMTEEGAAIQFVTPDGTPVLGYRDLHAYDSTGRALPARLSLKGERLSVMVDDRTAVYPVTIDPLIFSKTRLTASDGAENDYFGFSVSVDGDTVVVGAPYDDTAAGDAAGSAYVFVRSGPFWIQQAKLTASDGAKHDQFGGSVSVDGGTVVVGAPGHDTADPGVGSAYIFVRRGIGFWFLQAKLTASDGADYSFGLSVSVHGETVAVGAHRDGTAAGATGSAYVFVRSGTSWIQQARLIASDGRSSYLFGSSVSVDGDTVVVGAPLSNSAYVFVRSGTSWSQQAKLTASDGAGGGLFGYSVSVDGDTVVVGRPRDDTAAGADAGSAYVFVRSGRTSWSQQIKLTASDGAALDHFGASVSVDGNVIVVGAPHTLKPGSAYVYIRNGSLYILGAKLDAPDDFEGADFFGHSVAVSLGRQDSFRVVVGKPFHNKYTGSAYVFGFGQLSYITAAIDDVAILYHQAVLDAGQADALIANLEAAVEALDADNTGAAFDQLRAFIKQVDTYINARILSPTQGRTLIDQANDIISQIDR